jgi:hypothetical protein
MTYNVGDASASINNRVAAIDEKIKGEMFVIELFVLSINTGSTMLLSVLVTYCWSIVVLWMVTIY